MDDRHRQLGAAKAPTDKTAIQRQIDRLVYELYEIADDIIPAYRSSGNS